MAVPWPRSRPASRSGSLASSPPLPPKANLKSVTVYYTAGANVMFFEINEQA